MVLRQICSKFSFLGLLLFLAITCTQKKKETSAVVKNKRNVFTEDDLSTVIALDTLSTLAMERKIVEKMMHKELETANIQQLAIAIDHYLANGVFTMKRIESR